MHSRLLQSRLLLAAGHSYLLPASGFRFILPAIKYLAGDLRRRWLITAHWRCAAPNELAADRPVLVFTQRFSSNSFYFD